MENVRIELYLGEGATGAQCTISSAGSGVGSVGGIESSWTFEPRKQVRTFSCYDLGGAVQSSTISSYFVGIFQTCTRLVVGCFAVLGFPSAVFSFRRPHSENVLIVFYPERRFRVRHMRSRSTLRFLRTVSRLSGLTRFGFRVRHTRYTRACGQ